MTRSKHGSWEVCAHDGCEGVHLPTTDRCWTHASEQDLDAALVRLHAGRLLDARGVVLSPELQQRLFRALPSEFSAEEIGLRSTLSGEALFDHATFQGGTLFLQVTFSLKASFAQATFQGDADFTAARFQDTAIFTGATFENAARFLSTDFNNDAHFVGATFQGDADFSQAVFKGLAEFERATFRSAAWFDKTRFSNDVDFTSVDFHQTIRLGPILAQRRLMLNDVTFHQWVRILAATTALDARSARFHAGVDLQLRWGQVVLDEAELPATSRVIGVARFPGTEHRKLISGEPGPEAPSLTAPLGDPEPPPPRQVPFPNNRDPYEDDEVWFAKTSKQLPPPSPARPQLLSLRQVDAAHLTVSDLDLSACRFAQAHNLDQFDIEGQPRFAPAPPGWRWTKRQTIAEEHHSRHARGAHDWYPPACRPPVWTNFERPEPPHPVEVAALYRALRKGREDDKDEPGAADFYYGEMEMRRHARALDAHQTWQAREFGRWIASASEHLVLTAYWLVSGYALRAWRALATLLVVVLLAAVGLAFWGFAAPEEPTRPVRIDRAGNLIYATPPPAARPAGIDQLPQAVRFSARSATALLRGPERPLTPLGEWLEISMRLLGPVLLGLAIVSIRARVKR